MWHESSMDTIALFRSVAADRLLDPCSVAGNRPCGTSNLSCTVPNVVLFIGVVVEAVSVDLRGRMKAVGITNGRRFMLLMALVITQPMMVPPRRKWSGLLVDELRWVD